MFRRLSLKQQFSLATGFLLLGCLTMIGAIIYPSVRSMNGIGSDIRIIQQELEEDYTETQAMRRTLRELDTVQEEIEMYRSMAMPVGDELAVITELEHLAAEHALKQTLGAVYQPTPDPSVELPYYNFTIVLNGPFQDVFSYIQTIEARPYYVLIDSMTLSKSSEGMVSLRFDARIYVQTT